jgi:hypothetical protein
MAEENPHIEIKLPPKPINNSRELYLFENEKLILGRHGFIFRHSPNLKERIQESFRKQKEFNRTINLNKKIKSNSLENITKSRLNDTNSETNKFSQPILRFKNRTDFERICDTIYQYAKPSEKKSLSKILARHVKLIDNPSTGAGTVYRGGFQKQKLLNKRNNKEHHSNSFNIRQLDNNKFSDINNKEYNSIESKRPKIYFTRLQRLNVDAKKIRSNLHLKTHFKGVESVFINPSQIYSMIKEEELLAEKKKMDNYTYKENLSKKIIENNNEYKRDIIDLEQEEKDKEKLINTKEFTNYLNNKEHYYNDKIIKKYNIKKESEEEKINKIRNMNYLKKLAFISYDNNLFLDTGNGNTNSENTSNDEKKKDKKYEKENEIVIGDKVFHINNEIDKIAKEVLNKCNFYSTKYYKNKLFQK